MTDMDMPPLSKHDHPEPQTMVWSELEMRAIKDYARAYAAAEVAKERERAAKAAEDFLTRGRSPLGRSVAAAIRAG
jgi:hypothetical protein